VHELWEGLKQQNRVWQALFVREMQTRWGRRNLGFAWLFAESLVFAFPVFIIWSHIRSPYDNGIPLMPFMWSGYMPLLISRHVWGRSMQVLRGNSALLYHRSISPLDIYVGCAGLEAMGNLSACAVSFVILYMIGALDAPYDFPMMIVGFFYYTWWVFAMGLIVAVASERSEIFVHAWMVVSYLYIILSGFPYQAAWLPASIRNTVVLCNPALQGHEMVREGLYGNLVKAYYNMPELTIVLSTMTCMGLWMMRHARQHIEIL
jgi:capsular polysaccharide transport system permease protein